MLSGKCYFPGYKTKLSLSRAICQLTIYKSLNLTAANRVFIVEPQWNPSVENQAIGRVLRLGQGQSLLVTHYVVNLTVEQVRQVSSSQEFQADTEQEMRSQQDRKLGIAEIGWES